MGRLRTDAISLLIIALVVVGTYIRLFWPLSHVIVTPDYSRSDAWHFSMATKYLLWDGLQAGSLPFWVAEIGGGFPLHAEGQTGMFFLPNLILYSLFDFPTAYNMSLVLSFLLLGWGTYLFLRMVSLSAAASLFGALAFALSGITVVQIPHITLIQGFTLMPIMGAIALRMIRQKSLGSFLLFSFIGSQQVFAGFPQATFITMLLCALLCVLFGTSLRDRIKNLTRFVLGCIGILLLSAVQIIPSYEFLTYSLYPKGFTPDIASYYSYPVKHLLTILAPFALGNPGVASYPHFRQFGGSIFWENTAHLGFAPPLLACGMLFIWTRMKKQKKSLVVFIVCLLTLSFLLMLGSHSPLYVLYAFWPLNLFRVPSRFIWTFMFATLLAAAYTYDCIWRAKNRHVLLHIALSLLTILNTALLIRTWYGYYPLEVSSSWFAPPLSLGAITDGGRIFTVGSEAVYYKEFIGRGWKDMTLYNFLRNDLAANSNVYWHVSQQGVYAGRFLRRQTLLDNLLSESIEQTQREATLSAFAKKMLDMQNVTRVIAVGTLHQNNLEEVKKISQGSVAITVYKNPGSVGRAYLASDIIRATTVSQALQAMQRDDFIPGKHIIVEEDFPEINALDTSGTIDYLAVTNSKVSLLVKGVREGAVLTLTDTYYPGWIASIDNTPVRIYPANIRHRAIIVPAGNHTVTFTYNPASIRYGGWVSAGTHGVIGLLAVLPWFSAALPTVKKTLASVPHRADNRGRLRLRNTKSSRH